MSTSQIYTGFWIDHSQNLLIGATLTLPSEWGALLVSALTVLVTMAGGAVWTIVAWACHRHRSDVGEEDNHYYRTQIILRNPPTAAVAALQLFKAAPIGIRGRNRERHSSKELLFLIPLTIFVLFGAASVLVAKVATKNYQVNNVLLQSGNCGIVQTDGSDAAEQAFVVKEANDSRTASAYVDNCYHGASGRLDCSILPVTRLNYTTNLTAQCPFPGYGRCVLGDSGAIQLSSDYLDSNDHFGINLPKTERIKYRRVTTCSPIRTKGYVTIVPDVNSNNSDFVFLEFNFGPVVSGSDVVTNYTNGYLTRSAFDNIGYTLISSANSAGGADPSWIPIPDVSVPNADVSLHFMATNSVKYRSPVFDPFFSANGTYTDTEPLYGTVYLPDYYVNVLGCVDQFELCTVTSNGKSCTNLVGINQMVDAFLQLGPSPAQLALAERLTYSSLSSTVTEIVSGQNGNALQATKGVVSFFSSGLPKNQWQLEVTHWFETGLAATQQRVVEFVSNSWTADPSIPLSVQDPITFGGSNNTVAIAFKRQCSQQRVQSTGSHQNFSFLGFMIIIVICPTLVILSWTLDSCFNRIDRRPGSETYHKYEAYLADEKLDLLRVAMEKGGYPPKWETRVDKVDSNSDDNGDEDASFIPEHPEYVELHDLSGKPIAYVYRPEGEEMQPGVHVRPIYED